MSHGSCLAGDEALSLIRLYCSRPLPALAGSDLRTLCCAVYVMKGSGLVTLAVLPQCIELGIQWCVPYRSHEYCVTFSTVLPHIQCWHGLCICGLSIHNHFFHSMHVDSVL